MPAARPEKALQPECRGIPDGAVNSRQRAGREFQRHEGLPWERTGQVAGLLRREAESRIVFSVSQHDNNAFASGAQLSQAATDELALDLTPLMARQDGHGSQ